MCGLLFTELLVSYLLSYMSASGSPFYNLLQTFIEGSRARQKCAWETDDTIFFTWVKRNYLHIFFRQWQPRRGAFGGYSNITFHYVKHLFLGPKIKFSFLLFIRMNLKDFNDICLTPAKIILINNIHIFVPNAFLKWRYGLIKSSRRLIILFALISGFRELAQFPHLTSFRLSLTVASTSVSHFVPGADVAILKTNLLNSIYKIYIFIDLGIDLFGVCVSLCNFYEVVFSSQCLSFKHFLEPLFVSYVQKQFLGKKKLGPLV